MQLNSTVHCFACATIWGQECKCEEQRERQDGCSNGRVTVPQLVTASRCSLTIFERRLCTAFRPLCAADKNANEHQTGEGRRAAHLGNIDFASTHVVLGACIE